MARGTGAGGTAGRASARAERRCISANDLDRLAREMVLTGPHTWQWAEREGIEEEAMCALLMSATSTVLRRTAAGEDIVDALHQAIGQTFSFGWECHKQYGCDR